jgi:hypothetical protein
MQVINKKRMEDPREMMPDDNLVFHFQVPTV